MDSVKKRYAGKGALKRELRRKVDKDAEENSGLAVTTAGIKTISKSITTVTISVKSVKHIRKKLKNRKFPKTDFGEVPYNSLAPKFRLNNAIRKTKTGISKVKDSYTLDNTKNAVMGALESGDNTNTGAGSVNMMARAVDASKDGIKTGKAGVENVKNLNAFRKKIKTKRKARKEVKRSLGKKTERGVAKAAVAKTTQILASLISNPTTLIPLAIVTGALFFLIIISSIVSMISILPTQMIMADEATVESYMDHIKALDQELQNTIDSYRTNSSYDDVVIEYMGEIGAICTNWQELIAIIAVEEEQNLTYSQEEQQRLRELFEMLNKITTRTERFYCAEDDCLGHSRLYVQIHTYSMESIMNSIGFSEDEKEWARQLASTDLSEIFPGLDIDNGASGGLTPEEIRDLILLAPTTDIKRDQIRQTALSLVGRVPYFWGGKSAAGWNNRWNISTLVTAPGSSSSGTYQPYGLDCSGFTDWVYKTAGIGNILSAGGTAYQWSQSYKISDSDLRVGDLAFMQPPNSSGINHVGIFIGRDTNGNKLYCHCEWETGVTVNGFKGFKYFRRPYVKFKEE